jgi:hypothetical protein
VGAKMLYRQTHYPSLVAIFLCLVIILFPSCKSTPKVQPSVGSIISGPITKMKNDSLVYDTGKTRDIYPTDCSMGYTTIREKVEGEKGKVITVEMNKQEYNAFILDGTGKANNLRIGTVVNFLYKPNTAPDGTDLVAIKMQIYKGRLKSGNKYKNVTFIPKLLSEKEVQEIKNPSSIPSLSVQAPPPLPPAIKYSIVISDVIYGPYEMDQITQMVQKGTITKETLIWKEGMSQWQPAGLVSDLRDIWRFLPSPLPDANN